jgi:hypothetical protein
MVLPKVEPGTEQELSLQQHHHHHHQTTTTIPVSALTGDPTQTQVVTVNANGQVVHVRKQHLLTSAQFHLIHITFLTGQQNLPNMRIPQGRKPRKSHHGNSLTNF